MKLYNDELKGHEVQFVVVSEHVAHVVSHCMQFRNELVVSLTEIF